VDVQLIIYVADHPQDHHLANRVDFPFGSTIPAAIVMLIVSVYGLADAEL